MGTFAGTPLKSVSSKNFYDPKNVEPPVDIKHKTVC